MQYPGANTGMNLNVDGQGGQDLDLDDYVDLDHIFDEFLTRNFAEDPAGAAAARAAQQQPQGLNPGQLNPGQLPTLPLSAPSGAPPARPSFFSYPTDLASLHYGFGALPAGGASAPHSLLHPPTNPAPGSLMPSVMTVGAPSVPPAASEANSLPASKPAPKGRGTRRAAPSAKVAAAAAAAAADDSDNSSGAESNSSDEPKSRKKTNTSSDPSDKSLAERRHQALQEKNRRAQRRFRERQKAKIQDLHKQIEELTGRVGSLQTENTALQSRTSILEKVLEMRNEQIQVMQETKEDPTDGVEQEAVPGQALAGGAGELEVLSPDLLRRLTPEEMTNIYQKYVGELGHRLMELNQTNNPDHKNAVETLVKDVLLLLMRFSIVKPLETRKFVAGSRLNIPSEQDALLLWKGAMKRLELSEEQQREMVALKREFLNSMENVMEQRRQLNVQIQAHFPHASFHTKIALAYIKAHEAVTKLKDNLRSEHRLVLEFSAALFKKILTPVQMATLLVHAFPAVPDSLAISSAVAAELGEDIMPLPAAPAADATLSNTSLLLQALAPGSEAAALQQQRGINLPMGGSGGAGPSSAAAGPSNQAGNMAGLGALPPSAQQLLAKVASGEVKLSPQMLQVLQMGGLGQLNPMQQQFLAFQQQQQQAAAAAAAAAGGGAAQAGLLQQLQQQQQMGLMGLLAGAGGGAAGGAAGVTDDSSSGSSGLVVPGSRGM